MGKKKTKDLYFAIRQEQAVLRYIETTSEGERNDIYNKILKEPFR